MKLFSRKSLVAAAASAALVSGVFVAPASDQENVFEPGEILLVADTEGSGGEANGEGGEGSGGEANGEGSGGEANGEGSGGEANGEGGEGEGGEGGEGEGGEANGEGGEGEGGEANGEGGEGEGGEGGEGGEANGSSTIDAEDIQSWIKVFTAIIGALSALFAFINLF